MIEKGYRPVTIAAITGRVYRHEAYLDMTEQLAKQHPDVIVLPE